MISGNVKIILIVESRFWLVSLCPLLQAPGMGCLSTCGLWAASWLSCWPVTRCCRVKTKPTSWPASSNYWACPARSSLTPPREPRTLCRPKDTRGTALLPRCLTAPLCWMAAAHDEEKYAARRAARTGAQRWRAAMTRCSWTSSNSVWSGTRRSGWRPARHYATHGWGGDFPSRQQEPPRGKRPPPPNGAPPPPTEPSPPSPSSPPPPQPPRPPPPKPGLTWQRSLMPTETSSLGQFCPSWSAESERTPLAVVGVVSCAHVQPRATSWNWIKLVCPVLKSVWFFHAADHSGVGVRSGQIQPRKLSVGVLKCAEWPGWDVRWAEGNFVG